MWNPFRRADPEDDELAARAGERTWPTRLAWLVLVGGAAALVLRCGVATVVEIHGDGMAPTLLTGDHVLLIRGTWGLGAGDLVVYDPTPQAPPAPEAPATPQLPGPREGRGLPRHDGPRQPLRNTAVVDVDDLDLGDEWQAVQRRSGVAQQPAAPRSLRVGRILAVPGDRITFGEHGALGLAINGRPLTQEIGAPLRLAVRGPQDPQAPPARPRGTASEAIGERRYQVLTASPGPTRWPGMRLPADAGPLEVEADGYLVIADNRDEGACCDSRALGFVGPDRIRGEIVLRLGGRNHSHPDVAPDQHGMLWKP